MARELRPISINLSPDLLAEIENARNMLAASKANSTQKAPTSDWERLCDFCDYRNAEALPVLYSTNMQGSNFYDL